MFTLDERQETILDYVIRDYIRTAEPVASDRLRKVARLNLSPATIRNAMSELDRAGFLEQPHISGGRIPTDKAWRYFANQFIYTPGVYMNVNEPEHGTIRRLAGQIGTFIAFFDANKEFFTAGINEIFDEPEFRDYDTAKAFAGILENFEVIAQSYLNDASNEPKVYIGKEHPFRSGEYFGSIFFKNQDSDSLFISFGPKRMNYEKVLKVIYKTYGR